MQFGFSEIWKREIAGKKAHTAVHKDGKTYINMPTDSNEVVNLLELDEEGSVLAVWDSSALGRPKEGADDNSIVVLEDQHMDDEGTEDQGFDAPMDGNGLSKATIERPAEFSYDNWRKFSDMHPGRPNGMGFLIFGNQETWSCPFFFHQ